MRETLYSAKEFILIKNAKVHNLKGVDVNIPKNKLVVVTGVSGSGKSSLVFDTLYAEGQRRYVESLSAYARQFLMRMDKPDVEYIKGIAPAIAIEQKINSRTSRSTVGTFTELYDYLRLLYARIGRTFSPISGLEVKKEDVADVLNFINSFQNGDKVYITVPVIVQHDRTLNDQLAILLQNGFSRIIVNNEINGIEDYLSTLPETAKKKKKDTTAGDTQVTTDILLLIDRFVISKSDDDNNNRINDSVKTAFEEGAGVCMVEILNQTKRTFSNRFELDGMLFEEPNPHFFSFNSPLGACKTCEGFGQVLGIDPDLVFPNKSLSVFEEGIACWKGEKMSEYKNALVQSGYKFNFPIHRPIAELSVNEMELLWNGNQYFHGLHEFFKMVSSQTHKIQYRVMLSRYRGRTNCPDCLGSRIRKDAQYVKVGNKNLPEILQLPIKLLIPFFDSLSLNEHDAHIAKTILLEIKNRLLFMNQVGLGYLHLNRQSSTLSGGETQRIQLTRSLGSNLTSSLYILDEPSVGLHSRDTKKLIDVLLKLRDLGNTVIVVEHEEEMMRAADHIIDMGPLAGRLGGEVVFEGDFKKLNSDKKSLTTKYLNHELAIPVPEHRRNPLRWITAKGCRQNNLKNITVQFPLNCLVVVSGVSGSGKTTLIRQLLYPALQQSINGAGDKPGSFDKLDGDLQAIKFVEMVDQNPLGKSSRSNPITYIKAYDEIRELFANQPASKVKGLQPKHFSFNVEGGRCETCKGEGEVLIEMQFLADIHLTCDECNGNRFKQEILDIRYKTKNISEVLKLTVDEAMVFFEEVKGIVERIKPLQHVGLGYVALGQSSSTLSGGEAQRVKLASFLGKGQNSEPGFFIFDEPTTGLHFHDIQKLLIAFDALVNAGHTVLVVEHNLEVIKYADWLIDLGPEGGEEGGQLVYAGKPEGILKIKESYTGQYLKEKL